MLAMKLEALFSWALAPAFPLLRLSNRATSALFWAEGQEECFVEPPCGRNARAANRDLPDRQSRHKLAQSPLAHRVQGRQVHRMQKGSKQEIPAVGELAVFLLAWVLGIFAALSDYSGRANPEHDIAASSTYSSMSDVLD